MALRLGAQTPEPQSLDLNPSSSTYQLCDLNFRAPYPQCEKRTLTVPNLQGCYEE